MEGRIAGRSEKSSIVLAQARQHLARLLTHPIHVLQANVDVETRFSEYVRDAFGMDIVVHRNAGNEVPLLCGRSPEFNPGEDRLSLEYLKRLDGMPRMEAQGDGIRSFVGLLLHAIVVPYNILLADEPEAFLHPPQARLVGRLLATEVPTTCQLFLATHSGDVIKGLLDAGSKRVRVIRIVREGHINRVRELSNPDITQLWSDPVIRHSNVLDGLFHQNVVVCEAEGDCRFFEAMMCTADQPARILTRPNFMFVSASGSDRLHVVATALRRVGVPVAVLADFDVISEESKFQRLVEACGVPWREVAADWKVVWSSVNKRKPELDTADVKKEISAILDGCQSTHLPEKDARRIRSVIARSSSWQEAKNAGVGLIPSGDETQACQRLIKRCKESGLFILTCGELERFCPTIGGHGPTWVNNVLQRDLGSDPELQAARDFAGEIREWANGTSPGETADAE